ncbi:MAG: ATP-binding cassette domain-containing protein [Candidatus Lokiarchaeota archaeon]|nr:ATP-binding cassette domain-containing protein [Candidatus Lokiarchaeota archaeon]
MPNIVEVINLSKRYRLGDLYIYALRDINLEIEKGAIVSIMGPSGSGKTTLLNIIGCLDNPTSGEVYISGLNITEMGSKELTRIKRFYVGHIFQFYNLIPFLTAVENVELPMLLAKEYKKSERRDRAEYLLDLVGLSKRILHKPDELSGGEQQRVAVARALANDPYIILADEPTGDLDEDTGIKLVKNLREIVEETEKTLIMVTHDPNVAQITSRILKIKNGRIIEK